MTEAGRPASPLAKIFKATAHVEPYEIKAVVLGFLYYFFLLGSYYILRPVRDAMGITYGTDHLEDLFTVVFFATFLTAPIYAFCANRVKLSTLVPWVYGFFALSIVVFYAMFVATQAGNDKYVAASFYVWISVFNMFITSVFWSFMADLFSRTQAKRLYGIVAAGGSAGAIAGPAITAIFVNMVGTNTLLLISAAGFFATIGIVLMLVREKARLRTIGEDPQRTSMDHKLQENPFSGFSTLAKSPYLLGIAVFILLMTWISTILYVQQQEFIGKAFESREARTQANAVVDLIVNVLTIGIQLFGTSRLVSRFGVTTGLVLNPILMIVLFVGVAFSPVLFVLLGAQTIRRVSEYAIARPSREMLFTIVDQESKYKAKNVIDTVVYRFGDVSGIWVQNFVGMLGHGAVGAAVLGIGVSAVWAWVALRMGHRYENASGDHPVGPKTAAAAAE
jgi:AAA family ATP:ADP antiporter